MSSGDPTTNPAVGLGLLMAAGARNGRDKLTLIAPPALDAFGLWVEQLVAESTGKQGVGVVPIAGEALADAAEYGADRVFVRLRVAGAADEAARDAQVAGLAGHPVLTLDFEEPAALGAEFIRWEVATATACHILGVNAFDQPDTSKKSTSLPLTPSSMTSSTGPVRDPITSAPALIASIIDHDRTNG